jgi:hypothetical protein
MIRERTNDLFGVNCGQQGSARSHPLARSLVESIRFRFGFHGCCTLLQYWLHRSQSGALSVRKLSGLLGSVREDAEQWASVGRHCCQIQVSRSCYSLCASRTLWQGSAGGGIQALYSLLQDRMRGLLLAIRGTLGTWRYYER